MKVVDLLNMGGNFLKILHENGMTVKDYQYVPMVHEYLRLKREGNKTSYIVLVISSKYNICERKVYKILQRFLKDC